MNDNYLNGKAMFMYFYWVETIISVVAGFMLQKIPMWLNITFDVYLLLSIIFLSLVNKYGLFTEKGYKYLNCIMYMIMNGILSAQFNDTQVFIYAIYVHSVVLISYIDEKMYFFNWGYTMLSAVVAYVALVALNVETFDKQDYLIGAAGACGIQWLSYNLIKNFSYQQRKGVEQERSLDDLLKVVEAKCEDARQATRSKSEFLSNMSHEIRTPINTVLGMNEMILRESKNPDIIEYATNVSSSGKMLLSLVNDILDFSKIESGRMEIIPVEYQVSSVLHDLTNMITPKAKEKDLKLILDVDDKIPNLLCGDEVRIRQIVTNLLTNAVKYTDYGSVTLKTDFERVDDKMINLRFSVIDTGRGIKGSDIHHLFDDFQRVDQKRNRNIEGTGLGLSITKKFVDMMEGTLTVDSIYGGGSTFTVSIPQPIVKDMPMGDFEKQYNSKRKGKEHYHETFIAPEARILVVDDNAMNLKVVAGLLKQTQVHIDTATSGADCLASLREKSYNLLLLDHMMPDMDGLATLRRIRAEGLGKDMPIIALTANAVSGAREMYIDYGFTDYLSKPVVSRDLEKILYTLLPKELVINTAKEGYEELDVAKAYKSASIDTLYGIELCAGDKELYKEVLTAYFNQGRDNIEKLEEYFANANWKDYGILVHAIKSTSMNVGAKDFSELAKKQEQKVNSEDMGYVVSSFQDFISEYKKILNEVNRVMNN